MPKIFKASNTFKKPITIFFKYINELIPIKVNESKTLLQVAHHNKIQLEGACEGNLACSTCHVICDETLFKNGRFKENENKFVEIGEKENDLLDKAYGVGVYSRLGCQIKVNESLDNKVFEIPKATVNIAIDGYKPPIH